MKVNFGIELETLDGKPYPRTKEDATPADAGYCCIVALSSEIPEYRDNGTPITVPGDEKYRRYKLADKITKALEAREKTKNIGGNKSAIVELKAEEVALIKTLIAKIYSPVIVGRVYDILDPETAVEKIALVNTDKS